MPVKEKKILMVVAPRGFKDAECFIPRDIFEKSGALVRVASMNSGQAESEQGKKLEVDYSVDEIKARDYDAVVFVGGPGMVGLVEEDLFVDLARDFYDAQKLTTAICIAPVILANAGILTGRPATATPSAQSDLEEAGVGFTGEPVTVSGRIITASGPAAAEAFAKAIVKALE